MNGKCTKFLAGMAVVAAMAAATAGTAEAYISAFTKITPDLVSSTIAGVGTDHVVYAGGAWNSALSSKWWDPELGGDGDYTLSGEKYGFAGGSFSLSETAAVNLKVTGFNWGGQSQDLSTTQVYLYEGSFDRLNPNTNQVGWADGLAGLTWALQAGNTYWMVVTSDAPFIPNSGTATVTAEINATPVPIPGAVWLLGLALTGVAGTRRRQRQMQT